MSYSLFSVSVLEEVTIRIPETPIKVFEHALRGSRSGESCVVTSLISRGLGTHSPWTWNRAWTACGTNVEQTQYVSHPPTKPTLWHVTSTRENVTLEDACGLADFQYLPNSTCHWLVTQSHKQPVFTISPERIVVLVNKENIEWWSSEFWSSWQGIKRLEMTWAALT